MNVHKANVLKQALKKAKSKKPNYFAKKSADNPAEEAAESKSQEVAEDMPNFKKKK